MEEDPGKIAETATRYFREAGFNDAQVYPIWDNTAYLTLFGNTKPENFDFRKDTNLQFSFKNNNCVEVDTIWIFPPQGQRRGIGSKLVNVLGDFAKTQGCDKIYAYSLEQEESKRFWSHFPESKEEEPRNFYIPIK